MLCRSLTGAMAGAALATTAGAGPVYFATSGATLYRVSDNGVQTFDLGAEMNALAFDPNGRLWASEGVDSNGDGTIGVYEITNPFSASLAIVSRGDFLPGRTGSMSFMDDHLMGFETVDGRLLDIDVQGKSWSVAAMLGTGSTRPSSSAFDADTNSLYGIRGNSLYEFSLDRGFMQTSLATLDFGGIKGPDGGEWYDSAYHHAINDGRQIHVFTIDVLTGGVTELFAFDVTDKGSMGFAVADATPVPAPAGLALLSLTGLAATRRRR